LLPETVAARVLRLSLVFSYMTISTTGSCVV
jgi:hypothetical protein